MFFLEGGGGCFQTKKKLLVLTQRTVNKICSGWQKGNNCFNFVFMCCNHYHVLVRMSNELSDYCAFVRLSNELSDYCAFVRLSNELSDYCAFVRLSNELSDYCVLVRLSHELSDTGSLGSMELCADSDSGHGSSTSSTFDPQHHPPRLLGPASRHQSQSSLQHAPLSYQTPGKSPAPASFIHM